MSEVIEFPASGANRPARPVNAGPAQIIIFPGVRVERREFSLADRVSAPRKRPASRNQAADLETD